MLVHCQALPSGRQDRCWALSFGCKTALHIDSHGGRCKAQVSAMLCAHPGGDHLQSGALTDQSMGSRHLRARLLAGCQRKPSGLRHDAAHCPCSTAAGCCSLRAVCHSGSTAGRSPATQRKGRSNSQLMVQGEHCSPTVRSAAAGPVAQCRPQVEGLLLHGPSCKPLCMACWQLAQQLQLHLHSP